MICFEIGMPCQAQPLGKIRYNSGTIVWGSTRRWTKRRFILIVALCWAFYIPYEYGMEWRLLCSRECNIRVNLLLIDPALAVLSVISIGMAIRALFTITLYENQEVDPMPQLDGVLEKSLYVSDLECSLQFYQKIFGFELIVAGWSSEEWSSNSGESGNEEGTVS
jgi:hypothetical protein